MPALFIGRFQPFHLGHLSAIKQALKQTSHLYIGIGSTQYNFQSENPFTTGERIQMIQVALKEAKIDPAKYSIIPIPNIENYALWAQHVINYLPPFDTLFTGSNICTRLFTEQNKSLKNPCKIIKPVFEQKISATKLRELMLKNGKWEPLVPKSVATLLKKWEAPTRLKSIQAT